MGDSMLSPHQYAALSAFRLNSAGDMQMSGQNPWQADDRCTQRVDQFGVEIFTPAMIGDTASPSSLAKFGKQAAVG